VKALKNKIQDAEGISPDFIQLQMKGLALGDEVSLANLDEGAIDMTMTLRGTSIRHFSAILLFCCFNLLICNMDHFAFF
jgi:hypothetical protein